MPELPEVETMVRDLADRVVGRKIVNPEIYWERLVGHPTLGEFGQAVSGRRIIGIRRRGKFAIFDLDDRSQLAVHRGMTGSLLLRPSGSPDDRFVRARLALDDGNELRLDDSRKFGRLFWFDSTTPSVTPPWSRLGLEPLSKELTVGELGRRLGRRKASIKSVLLNQKVVAGIGNIYADESLFLAGIDPVRPSGSLSKPEIRRLRDAMQRVLNGAIEARGTTFSTYRDINGSEGQNQRDLMVFRRQPGPCPRCGGEIRRIVLGGRGTHFCSGCQV